MLVQDLFEDIPELKIDQTFINKLIEPKVKLENCSYGPRETTGTVNIPESVFMNEDNHENLVKMIESINSAVTKALQKEVSQQKKIQGLEDITLS
jgi:hypothetical protein